MMDKTLGSTHPENTETTLYIYCGMMGTYQQNFGFLLEAAKRHFGDNIDFFDLEITAEYIHTRCLTYDLYDPSDYDNYIVITRR